MVVGDFYMVRTLFRPAETKSVLLVDSNAVLPLPVTGEGFQSVAGRAFQIVETRSRVENEQFGSGSPPDVRWKRPGSESAK